MLEDWSGLLGFLGFAGLLLLFQFVILPRFGYG